MLFKKIFFYKLEYFSVAVHQSKKICYLDGARLKNFSASNQRREQQRSHHPDNDHLVRHKDVIAKSGDLFHVFVLLTHTVFNFRQNPIS